MKDRLQSWARRLKAEALTLWYVARHPDTPWYAKVLAAFAAAYAFSPIDLIPDFIPVLGYLDDLILLPLLIALAIRLVPRPIWETCRRDAEAAAQGPANNRRAMIVIITIWLAIAMVSGFWMLNPDTASLR